MIRKAEEKDSEKIEKLLAAIAYLHYRLRPDIFKSHPKHDLQSVKEMINDKNNIINVYADENDEPIGYSIAVIKTPSGFNLVDRKIYYVDDLCVDEKYRGKGIGTELMDYDKEEAKKLNCGFLELNVWSDNVNSVKFYEHCGFKTQKQEMEIKL